MENRAAQELAKLTQSADSALGMAEQQAAEARQRSDEQFQQSLDQQGEAKFAAPEALATAVVGSFLFGPGGVLLGAAQGWLGKKQRQNILDKQAAKNETFRDSQEIISRQFDELESLSTNEFDKKAVGSMRIQHEAGVKLITSGDPQQAQQGMALITGAQDRAAEFIRTQETQAIAAEAAEQQRILDMGKTDNSNYMALAGSYDSQSQAFKDGRQAANTALRALESGNAFEQASAIVSFVKSTDPASIVSSGEQAGISGIGGAIDKLTNIVGSLENGAQLNLEQRQEMSDALRTVMAAQQAQQQVTDLEFSDRADLLGLPPKYKKTFSNSARFDLYQQAPVSEWSNIGTAERGPDPVPQGAQSNLGGNDSKRRGVGFNR